MTRLEGYEVSVARQSEAEEVLRLLKYVAEWLKEKGSNQWETLLEGEDDQEIVHTIKENYTYVVKQNSRLLATFTIYPRANSWDDMLWGSARGDEATYLHKLAVSPNQTGRGLGKQILEWIENDLRKNGVRKLRLDCIEGNENLNIFYTKAGYRKVASSHGFSLYEKELL